MNPALLKYQNESGYFCISTHGETWQNTFFSASEILEADKYISENRQKNCYSSISLFEKPTVKSILNVIKPLELISDMDAHLAEEEATLERVLEYVERLKEFFNNRIPEPSVIVYTGRGFQCHWYLKWDSEIEISYKWRITQEALTQRLAYLMEDIDIFYGPSEYKLDTSIQEESRSLRIPDTYNTKAGRYSKVIYNSGSIYSLLEVMENFNLVHGTGKKAIDLKEVARLNTDEILKATDSQLKKYKSKTKGFTVQTLSRARLEDLLKLIHLRNAAEIRSGYRNNLINILVEILQNLSGNANEIRTTVEYVNNEFLEPLSSSEVRKWIQLKSHNKQHFFKTKTILEKLAITEEEMQHMKTLISRKESNSRYYQNHTIKKKNYRNRQYKPIKEQNAQAKAERRAQVKALYAHGEDIAKIANALNISTRTVYRDLKKIFPE